MGSVLTKDGKDLWAPSVGAVTRIFQREALVRDLTLAGDDPQRPFLDDGVTATQVMPDITIIPGFIKIDGYAELMAELAETFDVVEGNVYADPPNPHANLFPFPYDWRRDNRSSAARLKTFVDRQLKLWRERPGHPNPNAKVILIGHSMGGLIARYYLEVLGGWEHCKALFTLGTPFRGSLKILDYLSNGYKILWLDVSEALRSFTASYQLLPIYPIVDQAGTFTTLGQVTIDNLNGDRVRRAVADFHDPMAAGAKERYQEHPDAYRHYGIIGIQQPTLQSALLTGSRIKVEPTLPRTLVERHIPDYGDATVPHYSALITGTPFDATAPIFVPHTHGALQNNPVVRQQLIYNLRMLQVTPDALGPGQYDTTDQSGLSLQLEDAYLTTGGQIRVQALNGDPGTVDAKIDNLDEPADARTLPMLLDGDTWVADLEGLAPGLYRATIVAQNQGAFQPVQDLFEVVAPSA
jgi:pimeloyl-ACP methyl ester carboxylesterase